jgi:hypothetical protein
MLYGLGESEANFRILLKVAGRDLMPSLILPSFISQSVQVPWAVKKFQVCNAYSIFPLFFLGSY